MQQPTGQAYVERYGHEWNVPERAREYVERTDRDAEQRAETFRLMVGLMPFEHSQPIRVLDIGTGQGAVAAVVLDAFPHARAVGLDVSEPMMEIAKERMARYGDRFRYYLGDFVDGELPPDLGGPFDVAVAARAIHHLPSAKKQLLYKAIYGSLNPGGCFFNVDKRGAERRPPAGALPRGGPLPAGRAGGSRRYPRQPSANARPLLRAARGAASIPPRGRLQLGRLLLEAPGPDDRRRLQMGDQGERIVSLHAGYPAAGLMTRAPAHVSS